MWINSPLDGFEYCSLIRIIPLNNNHMPEVINDFKYNK